MNTNGFVSDLHGLWYQCRSCLSVLARMEFWIRRLFFTNAKFNTLAVMLRLIAVFLDQLRALYGRDLGVSLALLGLPRNVLS